jgi:hypothetical protein
LDIAETTMATGRRGCCSAAKPARGDAHALGRADAGAAELHDEQIVQLKSFPLVIRARTSFQNLLFHLIEGQAGGIDVDGVGRLGQRRFGAGAVALVALADLGGDGFGRHGFALLAEVAQAAAHALLAGRRPGRS